MGSRHRQPNRLRTSRRAVRFAGATLAAPPAVVGVLLLVPRVDAVGVESHPKPVAQEGRLIAVSPDSLTAQSADGSARTYLVTPQTTAVTIGGGGAVTAAFDVNDEVSIVGVMRDGTAVATAVAARAVADLNGPPMDAIGYTP